MDFALGDKNIYIPTFFPLTCVTFYIQALNNAEIHLGIWCKGGNLFYFSLYIKSIFPTSFIKQVPVSFRFHDGGLTCDFNSLRIQEKLIFILPRFFLL